ncbi:MAG: transcription-repair coupling factor [Lachnospiraceae bacterium]|nr:transcription-repair coupling factor [Lachnospiraceae bacterium]
MNAFLKPLKSLAGFKELEEAVRSDAGLYSVTGCTDAQKPHFIYAITRASANGRLIVVPSETRARELLEAYRFFDPVVRYFPAKDILFYQSDIRGNALTRERMEVYRALLEGEDITVITTFDALMDRLIPPQALLDSRLSVKQGTAVDLDDLRSRLARMGYEYADQTEEPGQFCVRGGILDVFPLTEETPYRIELWGDEVDSIRSFSPESQRSIETVESLMIYPAGELVLDDERLHEGVEALTKDAEKQIKKYRDSMLTEEAARIRHSVDAVREELLELVSVRQAEAYLTYFYSNTTGFLDYFTYSDRKAGSGEEPLLFIDEPARCQEKARAVEKEFFSSMEQRLKKGYILPGQTDMLIPAGEVWNALSRCPGLALSNLETRTEELPATDSAAGQPARRSPLLHKEPLRLNVRSVNTYNGSFSLLVKDLTSYKKQKYSVILLCGSRTRAQRMARDLQEEGLTAFYSEDTNRVVSPGEAMVLYGVLPQGFCYPDIRFVVLTETDIFGAPKKRTRKKRYQGGERIASFTELKPGDYVVHENHGLGIYRGIEQVEMNRTQRDYMKIEYDKGSSLYVPATQLDVIQRYSGSDGRQPKLNRLGGQEWKHTRSRVRQSVQVIARDLVELYAIRQSSQGYRYGQDTVWQREFEEMFPYEETEDQLTAIADIKSDMESGKIMDRLLCGDVGFGKTEVALRAAFKAVQENKQVVYLVPTTILAQQHYDNFVERLKNFPVNVELLCRFRTQAQQRETIKRLKQGMTDIVIGTHRVLSDDVEYKDLGLLIIDEEQRFGVTHKEKIKQLKKTVDVLALTATPIPRTLHMSMVGIRDMSVLEEPPQDRLPIQTYIMEYNEEMVREAIERELARGGQVYYVYNRVNTIADQTARIARLVPDAEVAFAHGQMSERELERVMYRFIDREIDVLVSTTIIETGMDIANVNTMIVHDADTMGLSQLYQLRGRIGRSNRTSYAFLMYRRDKILKEVAEKRLSAIREFTELGSGIRIARKDLEIRGAGNLLGEQQHGHMEAVGYELYCKMLNEAVREAKGEPAVSDFETAIDLELDAYIPSDYIENEVQKLDIYKRIAAVGSEEERDEMTDELIDRFGEPPRSVQNLLAVAMLREQAHAVFVTEIKETPDGIIFSLYPQAVVDPAKIPDAVKSLQPGLSFQANRDRPRFVYRRQKSDPDTIRVVQRVLDVCREICL